jgi:hypothetical protein
VPGDALASGRSAIALADVMPPPESESLPGTAIRRPLSPHRSARVLGLGEREEPKSEPDPLLAGVTEPAGGANARPRPPVAGGARPADFAPASDRVMDGFARVESAVMSPGGTVARQGRVIRFPRPVWTLGSYADVWSGIGLPIRFVIEMQLDENGAVRSARLLEGTGRPSIDRPILVAAHGARLDPTRDEAGRPRADTIAFVLTVR